MTLNVPQRKAYDTLKGFIYAAAPSPDVKFFIEHELDILYESWYRLANGRALSAALLQNPERPSGNISSKGSAKESSGQSREDT